MSIGERITALRKEKKISQGTLAKTLGISRQAVSKWESDQSNPDTLNLIRLSDLLDTDIEYLATGRKKEAPAPLPPDPPKPSAPPEPPRMPRPSRPVIVNLIEKEAPVQERIVEKPVIRRVVRVRWRQNPFTLTAVGIAAFLLGLLVGSFI